MAHTIVLGIYKTIMFKDLDSVQDIFTTKNQFVDKTGFYFDILYEI